MVEHDHLGHHSCFPGSAHRESWNLVTSQSRISNSDTALWKVDAFTVPYLPHHMPASKIQCWTVDNLWRKKTRKRGHKADEIYPKNKYRWELIFRISKTWSRVMAKTMAMGSLKSRQNWESLNSISWCDFGKQVFPKTALLSTFTTSPRTGQGGKYFLWFLDVQFLYHGCQILLNWLINYFRLEDMVAFWTKL